MPGAATGGRGLPGAGSGEGGLPGTGCGGGESPGAVSDGGVLPDAGLLGAHDSSWGGGKFFPNSITVVFNSTNCTIRLM